MKLKIVHLYPKLMNIYGDTGNVLVLQKRMQWRGLEAEVVHVGLGDDIPNDVDIIISGGGQDTGQLKVAEDLLYRGEQLRAMANDGVGMLVVCGTYQLFGHRFVTNENVELKGIGIFDAETIAGPNRLIGNVVSDTTHGELVGYENHSGLTNLFNDQQRFGSIISGEGNNDSDDSEGAITNNVIGTYLHGPLLPKNQRLADAILHTALIRKYGKADLQPLEDEYAVRATEVAQKLKR